MVYKINLNKHTVLNSKVTKTYFSETPLMHYKTVPVWYCIKVQELPCNAKGRFGTVSFRHCWPNFALDQTLTHKFCRFSSQFSVRKRQMWFKTLEQNRTRSAFEALRLENEAFNVFAALCFRRLASANHQNLPWLRSKFFIIKPIQSSRIIQTLSYLSE